MPCILSESTRSNMRVIKDSMGKNQFQRFSQTQLRKMFLFHRHRKFPKMNAILKMKLGTRFVRRSHNFFFNFFKRKYSKFLCLTATHTLAMLMIWMSRASILWTTTPSPIALD
jgi:hypothetical protein